MSTRVSKAREEARTLLEQMAAPPRHPKGTRIEITSVGRADRKSFPINPGDQGTVVGGNALQVWVEFDSGVSVTLVAGVDHYQVLKVEAA